MDYYPQGGAVKNFDEGFDQDLEFVIQGQVFKMRYVRPEVLATWEDEPDDAKTDEILKRQDERICSFLADEEQAKRWMDLRQDEDNALPLVKLNELLRWMVEVQTSRPTPAPSPSATGRGKTAASLRAASS